MDVKMDSGVSFATKRAVTDAVMGACQPLVIANSVNHIICTDISVIKNVAQRVCSTNASKILATV